MKKTITINYVNYVEPKPQPVKTVPIEIDGIISVGRPINREEFIKKFYELQTLILTDDEKYWVLYDERFPETPWYEEIFWCIPYHELCFVNIDHQWYLHEPDYNVPECLLDNLFKNFYAMFVQYCARYTRYASYRTNTDPAVVSVLCHLDDMYKAGAYTYEAFIGYLLKDWHAYAMSILNGEFKYMNCTEIVYSSWVDYITKK